MIQPGRTYVAALTLGSKSPVVQATLAAAAAKKVTAMAAELRGEAPKGPARVSLAKAGALDDEEDEVVVTDGDGNEVELDPDAPLAAFLRAMDAAFPVAGESMEDKLSRAQRLRAALQDWVQKGSPGAAAPMAASAYSGANATQRTLSMVRASKAFRSKPFDLQFAEACRLARSGSCI